MKLLMCLFLTLIFAFSAFPCTVSMATIRANAIYGRVIDITKNPISNAIIQLYKVGNNEKILAETIADENGIFKIKSFLDGNYRIKAKANYFDDAEAVLKLKKYSAKAKNKEIVFILHPNMGCGGWVKMEKIQKSK